MKVKNKVISTFKPKKIGFDQNHVYVYSNIVEVPEEEKPIENRKGVLYSYTVTEYEKDEFLSALSSGQITLDNRTSALEEMVLDMSQEVYS